jgi:phosphatidylinositol alpha-1,6-mannosyltransferase
MTSPAKVLLIANNFPPIRGGSAVVYDNLARYAADRIVVVAPQINYNDGLPLIGWREHDRTAAYRVIRLPLLRTNINVPDTRGGYGKLAFWMSDLLIRMRLLLLLRKLFKTENIAAVCIGELLASGWLIDVLHRISSARTVIYVHGEEITTEDIYDADRARAKRALRKADRIVVVSRFTQNAVLDLLGPDAAAKITLVENGVSGDRFFPRPKRPDLVEQYRLAGCFVFVSVCRLLEKKGIDHAIQAFARVARRYPECRYLIVGAGPYESQLRDLAHRENVADRVIFAGDVPDEDLAEHYCLGDVFAMPNRRLPNGDTEGFGLVFLEANACGIPVIAGSDGGSRDAVKDGVNGLVVDGASVDRIADAMMRLREDPVLRETLRARSLEVAAAANWRRKTSIFLQLCTGADGSPTAWTK